MTRPVMICQIYRLSIRPSVCLSRLSISGQLWLFNSCVYACLHVCMCRCLPLYTCGDIRNLHCSSPHFLRQSFSLNPELSGVDGLAQHPLYSRNLPSMVVKAVLICHIQLLPGFQKCKFLSSNMPSRCCTTKGALEFQALYSQHLWKQGSVSLGQW